MAGLPKCVEGAGQKEVHVPMSGAAGGNSNGRVDVDSDMQDATSDVSQLSEDEFDAILDAAFDQLVTDVGRQVRAGVLTVQLLTAGSIGRTTCAGCSTKRCADVIGRARSSK